jgi:hypothetical protein
MTYLQSGEVEELFGISHRTLDYWVRTDLVAPTVEAQGYGSRRLWSVEDAVKVGVIAQLREAGVPVQRVRRWLSPGWWFAVLEGSKVTVVVGGKGAVRLDMDAIRERVESAQQLAMDLSEVGVGDR